MHYFTNYPVVGLILWIGNLICGLLAPVLYLFKNKKTYIVAYYEFLKNSNREKNKARIPLIE